MTSAVPPGARAAIVAAARASIGRGSQSFAAASRLFARPVRERAWLLYAWCRACDDIADGQDHGHELHAVDDPAGRLAAMTAKTEAALVGRHVGEMPFDALGIVAAETGLPHGLARDHLAGFALDADGWRPRTEDDLLRYCYHVAGVVGCMMAIVMGVDRDDEATLDRACDLGIAFQLANIARDIAEDAAAGRCYLPQAWLDAQGVDAADVMAPASRPGLAVLAARLATLAGRYERSAAFGTPALSFRSAWAVLAAAAIYGEIGRAVARRGAAAWDSRVTTSRAQKIGFIWRSRGQAAARGRFYGPQPRDPALWTRPRHG